MLGEALILSRGDGRQGEGGGIDGRRRSSELLAVTREDDDESMQRGMGQRWAAYGPTGLRGPALCGRKEGEERKVAGCAGLVWLLLNFSIRIFFHFLFCISILYFELKYCFEYFKNTRAFIKHSKIVWGPFYTIWAPIILITFENSNNFE